MSPTNLIFAIYNNIFMLHNVLINNMYLYKTNYDLFAL